MAVKRAFHEACSISNLEMDSHHAGVDAETLGKTPLLENSKSSSTSLSRDTDYYTDKAVDCVVIRVEDTLFKIARWLFVREQSTLSDVLLLPQDTNMSPIEGSNDENPIVLPDVTVDDFRALCWGLHLLPPEVQTQKSENADVPRFMSLAVLSNKFGIQSLEKWSTDIIFYHCSSPSGLNFATSCSHEYLEKLISISSLSNRPDIRETVEDRWIARLQNRSADTPMHHALDVGEKFGLRGFQGRAYYEEMLNMSKVPVNLSNLPEVIPDRLDVPFDTPALKKVHVDRLRSGIYSLQVLWDSFCRRPFRSDGCTNLIQTTTSSGRSSYRSGVCQCESAWRQSLGTAASRYVTPDVRGKLSYLLDKNISHGWRAGHGWTSSPRLQKLYDQVLVQLPDHFLGKEETPR